MSFKSDGVVDWAQITTLMVEENKAVCVFVCYLLK